MIVLESLCGGNVVNFLLRRLLKNISVEFTKTWRPFR